MFLYVLQAGKLKEKIGELEIAMREKVQECEDLRESQSANKKVVNHLEQELKNLEERYREDVSARNLIVAKLRREVDDKSATIAYLISKSNYVPSVLEMLHLGLCQYARCASVFGRVPSATDQRDRAAAVPSGCCPKTTSSRVPKKKRVAGWPYTAANSNI